MQRLKTCVTYKYFLDPNCAVNIVNWFTKYHFPKAIPSEKIESEQKRYDGGDCEKAGYMLEEYYYINCVIFVFLVLFIAKLFYWDIFSNLC